MSTGGRVYKKRKSESAGLEQSHPVFGVDNGLAPAVPLESRLFQLDSSLLSSLLNLSFLMYVPPYFVTRDLRDKRGISWFRRNANRK